ncbi:hypothetical protein ABPG77_011062 [Micractinium sp. CCAP 211/92]
MCCSRVPKGPKRGLAQQPHKERERGLSTAAAVAAPAGPQQAGAEAAAPEEEEGHGLRLLSSKRALLLDAAYRPVGVANWQRAICLHILNKADVLEYYEESVRAPSDLYPLPAVLRVPTHCSNPSRVSRVALNRHNIILRDQGRCQYCGSAKNLTIDHVVPQSKGGRNTWENLVACCSTCNSRKGDKSLEQLGWKLHSKPTEPSPHRMEFLLAHLRASHDNLPPEWSSYILPFTRTKKQQQQQQLS